MKLKSAILLDFWIEERYYKMYLSKDMEFRNDAVFDWNRISIADFGLNSETKLS